MFGLFKVLSAIGGFDGNDDNRHDSAGTLESCARMGRHLERGRGAVGCGGWIGNRVLGRQYVGAVHSPGDPGPKRFHRGWLAA